MAYACIIYLTSITIKNCVVVPIFLADKLLVAIDSHQGNDIVDLFGSAVKDGEDSRDVAIRSIPALARQTTLPRLLVIS